MVLELSKILHFLQLYADLSKKFKSIKDLITLFEKIAFSYRSLNNISRDIEK